ncbi:MAG: hypothetical protein IBX60_07320 [Candidatus Aminicenantes bacterium]|nr:hypothetical protein [Candidatus Aminicenantes bacterium]
MKKGNALIAVILIFWASLAMSCQKIDRRLSSTNAGTSTLSPSENILSQKRSEREFSSNTLELVAEINLENLERPCYKPTFLKFDEKGDLYTVDFSEFLIHKFTPFHDWTNCKHSFFGKGTGQGPGELSRVLDFKIFKDEVYLVDETTGSIELYATDGTYKKRIVLSNHLVPRRMTVQDKRIIVESLAPNGPLFFVYDLSGNMIFSFGELIDKTNVENSIYQDNELSDSFSGNRFYYLPRFLGFVGLYEGDRLVMAKETVDGLKIGKKNVPVEKAPMKGVIVRTMSKKYETVLLHALHKDFILIKTYDYEKKRTFWDIYDLYNFNYLMSVKNPPISQFFAIHEDYLALLIDTETGSKIQIIDMRKVLEEI